MYRPRAVHRGITAQEVAGLDAVLRLVSAVAAADELSRVALCERAAPPHLCVGLLTCGVPLPIKVQLVNALEAFR